MASGLFFRHTLSIRITYSSDIERRQAGWVGACYQRGVGLWVWVLRIVGARADGVLGRLLLAVRWDPRPLPSARFAVNVVLQLRESKSMCLPHTKLLAGAPEARRAAAMSAAPWSDSDLEVRKFVAV